MLWLPVLTKSLFTMFVSWLTTALSAILNKPPFSGTSNFFYRQANHTFPPVAPFMQREVIKLFKEFEKTTGIGGTFNPFFVLPTADNPPSLLSGIFPFYGSKGIYGNAKSFD